MYKKGRRWIIGINIESKSIEKEELKEIIDKYKLLFELV
jgi:hypothetical protein